MNFDLKLMLNTTDMIPYLKSKNIKFKNCSEKDALIHLKNNNNYYNIVLYKNNFSKYNGKYIDLDFAYLKDLSIIDTRVRRILYEMILDIEHYLKIRILNTIENIPLENGYKIVNLYLEKDFNDKKYPKRLHNSFKKKKRCEYHKDILMKYNLNSQIKNMPIWEFFKVITFGELIHFFSFFTNYYNLKDNKYIFILKEINQLRNAVAHNLCILSKLNKSTNKKYDALVINYLKKCDIEKDIIYKNLSNSCIKQITYTLYLYNIVVTSKGRKDNIYFKLTNLFYKRIILNKDYYVNNKLLKSIYSYFDMIIEKNYKVNII